MGQLKKIQNVTEKKELLKFVWIKPMAWHIAWAIFELQISLLFMYIMGLAEMELTFPIAPIIVLCLLFVARMVFIIHLAATQGQPNIMEKAVWKAI